MAKRYCIYSGVSLVAQLVIISFGCRPVQNAQISERGSNVAPARGGPIHVVVTGSSKHCKDGSFQQDRIFDFLQRFAQLCTSQNHTAGIMDRDGQCNGSIEVRSIPAHIKLGTEWKIDLGQSERDPYSPNFALNFEVTFPATGHLEKSKWLGPQAVGIAQKVIIDSLNSQCALPTENTLSTDKNASILAGNFQISSTIPPPPCYRNDELESMTMKFVERMEDYCIKLNAKSQGNGCSTATLCFESELKSTYNNGQHIFKVQVDEQGQWSVTYKYELFLDSRPPSGKSCVSPREAWYVNLVKSNIAMGFRSQNRVQCHLDAKGVLVPSGTG